MHGQKASLQVQAPAKLNLFFEVLAKRTDGYHEIETLMCPITLYDTLSIGEGAGGQIELTCTGPGGASGWRPAWWSDVPSGPTNLVYRAVDLVRQRYGVQRGVRLQLTKRIPTAAGMGGGSSDAAAALVGVNRFWELGRSREELASLGAELGSDVPFFLASQAAVCRGRGEQVEPVDGLGSLWFVVVRPPEGLSTPAVYRACRPAIRPRRVSEMLEVLREGRWEGLQGALFNRLEPAAASLSPWIERLRRALAREDCVAHAMSGSGSSYFGVCRHARHAMRVAARLRAKIAGSIFAVRSCRGSAS